MYKRILAAALALLLLAGCLTGCGKKTGASSASSAGSGETQTAKPQTTAKYVYNADYIDPAMDKSSTGVNSFCVSGDYVYLATTIMTDPGQGTNPNPGIMYETGVQSGTATADAAAVTTDTAPVSEGTDASASSSSGSSSSGTDGAYIAPTYASVIYQIDLKTGDSKTFDAYKPMEAPKGSEGSSYVGTLLAGADGSVWVNDSLNSYVYNLPADFDAAKDNKENYATPNPAQSRVQQFSADGKLLNTVSFQADENGNVMQVMAVDGENHLYATDYTKYCVLDASGKTLKTLDLGKSGGSLIPYNGGAAVETWDSTTKLQPVNPDTFELSAAIELPPSAGAVYPSTDEAYDFLYDNGGSIYGYKLQEKTSEKVVDWIDCDVDSNQMLGYTVMSDGRVLGVLNQQNSDGTSVPELVLLTRTNSADVKPKTVLTMACLYVDWSLRSSIVAFNKASDKYRIVVNDYSQYNTGDDYTAGFTKLNTEIISGKVPDLIYTADLPIGQYAAQGLLEDLVPYIDKDKDLGADALMPEILAAAETDGHLYRAFSTFYISSAVGLDKVVGGYSTWTLADLKDAMKKLKSDATVFSVSLTKSDVLTNCLSRNLSSLVDWQTGKCSFDGDDFKDLLRFANSFPDKFDSDNFDWSTYPGDQQSMLNGEQLLMDTSISSVSDYLNQLVMFNNQPIDFVGYPTQTGSGSTFILGEGLAITKTCADKDGAWSFVRQYFTADSQIADGNAGNGLSVNKSLFDKQVKDLMTVTYQTDEKGNQVKDENGKPVVLPKVDYMPDETHHITIDVMTQAQLDSFMALYRSVKTVNSPDSEISKIVTDEAASYFAGQKTLDETASMIQNRVNLYVQEQK
jgi:ABC-type glycerol-3-phosphate transport system substrate-binding protein